jgi:hypothetical protein
MLISSPDLLRLIDLHRPQTIVSTATDRGQFRGENAYSSRQNGSTHLVYSERKSRNSIPIFFVAVCPIVWLLVSCQARYPLKCSGITFGKQVVASLTLQQSWYLHNMSCDNEEEMVSFLAM